MTAILVFIELVIRGGILLLKMLAVAAGVTLVVAAIVYPQVFAGVAVFLAIVFVAWHPVKEWLRSSKKDKS